MIAPAGFDDPCKGVGRAGRFVFTRGDPRVSAYLLRNLLIPHGRMNRLRRRLLPRLPLSLREPLLTGRASGDATALAQVCEAVFSVLRAVPVQDALPDRWIALTDGSSAGHGRMVLFVFGRSGNSPVAVLKARVGREQGDGQLAREWRALRDVSSRCEFLRVTLPSPLTYRCEDELEALVTSVIGLRSAYAELKAGPPSDRTVIEHFTLASDWLARFHAATTSGWARMRAMEVPVASAHGDFWPHNLMVNGHGAGPGVVDWEHHESAAPCTLDLFRFPLSYALVFPWLAPQARTPEERFRRAFLGSGPLAAAVREYFAIYCEATGLEKAALPMLLRLHLSMHGMPKPAPPRETPAGDATLRACERMIAEAIRPAFAR